jgi:hypothetical protein
MCWLNVYLYGTAERPGAAGKVEAAKNDRLLKKKISGRGVYPVSVLVHILFPVEISFVKISRFH